MPSSPAVFAHKPVSCGVNERRVLRSPDESPVDRVGGLIIIEIIKPPLGRSGKELAALSPDQLQPTGFCFEIRQA